MIDGPDHPRSARPGRAGWWAGATVVLVAAVAGVALAHRSDDGSTTSGPLDEIGGVPVLAGAYRTDGELADGLAIPPGTALLGDVLPAADVYSPEGLGSDVSGWQAFLLVLGDMAEVLDNLDAQAAGLALEPYVDEYYGPLCEVASYTPPDGLVQCRRAWQGADLWVDISMQRGTVPAGAAAETARPVSLLLIDVGHLDVAMPTTVAPPPPTTMAPPTTAPPTTSTTATPPTTSVAPPSTQSLSTPPTTTPDEPMPDAWPDPPGPGQALADGISATDSRDVLSLRLPEGAHAVVAPWPTGGNARNYTAIVAVSGDVETVTADLAGQIREWFDEPTLYEDTAVVDGVTIASVRGDQPGGSKLDLTWVTVEGRTWITVSSGYD